MIDAYMISCLILVKYGVLAGEFWFGFVKCCFLQSNVKSVITRVYERKKGNEIR